MGFAVSTENDELCRYLIANEAEIGVEALPRATKNSLESMVWLLIDHGATVSKKLVKQVEKRGDIEIAASLRSRLHASDRGMRDGQNCFRKPS
jgi:hypothetical protein